MRLSDFDYNLPKELIAKELNKPRDHSRLLILHKDSGKIEHKKFFNIIDYLKPGDVLVLNNSKVIPARLIGIRKDTGKKIEILLSKKNHEKEIWQCMCGSKIKPGMVIEFENNLTAELIERDSLNTCLFEFNQKGQQFMKTIEKIGKVPLPPYIKRELNDQDKEDYQTVYAEKKGSVAAPTAGFHFTKELLEKIKDKGVKIEYITLHVGLGTFLPVRTNIKDHHMHSEWVEVSKQTIDIIKKAQRVIVVGTTSCRSLEAVWKNNELNKDFADWVDIFIYPGYRFKITDALITNFHLPKTTLIMLVSALAGKENIDKAYMEAVEEKYRFYSYGDAMFII
ncbi:MAG: tRNA preQ1(34) S-adenosylmethionine ribosyltransferase-isomerase QueA [bacterium]